MTRAQAKRIASKIKYASYTEAVGLVWKELEIVKKASYEFEKPK